MKREAQTAIERIRFLIFLRDRLVNVYKESPNTDFVLELENIIRSTVNAGYRFGDISESLRDELVGQLENRGR